MDNIKQFLSRFTMFEKLLWLFSILLITISFFATRQTNYLTLFASLIGATMLIFMAKGMLFAQFLSVAFCVVYSIISYNFTYYGEMITFMFMSLPISILSIFTWLKNPSKANKKEVKVNSLNKKDIILMIILTAFVTVIFYFILKYFNTKNLILSTISIATSFLAMFMVMKRSAFYAIAYALNDIVLIGLWTLACIDSIQYLSMVICFSVFLVNDIYAFFNWKKMNKRQLDFEKEV